MAMKEGMDLLTNSQTSQLDSQLLLSHVLGVERTYLFLNREEELQEDKYIEFKRLIELRKKGVPLQYITGYQEFMSLSFKVSEGVLIPRCDTECLVEVILENLKDIENPVIADVGCGSGAISISIANYKKDALVYALDIMDTPLILTKENAKLNNVDNNVKILKSNMLSALIEIGEKVNMVVSNPPYIRSGVITTLMAEVKDYEPMTALDGGVDGLIFYRNITKESKEILVDNGILAYEIGHDQGEDVKNIMIENGFKNVSIIKDLSGMDRIVIGHI